MNCESLTSLSWIAEVQYKCLGFVWKMMGMGFKTNLCGWQRWNFILFKELNIQDRRESFLPLFQRKMEFSSVSHVAMWKCKGEQIDGVKQVIWAQWSPAYGMGRVTFLMGFIHDISLSPVQSPNTQALSPHLNTWCIFWWF